MPEIPERIGPYRVESVLGQGGMAVVYAAVDPDGRPVALKWLTRVTPLRVARFAEEVRVLERLEHPNVPRLRDRGEHAGRPYVVLDRVEGMDLRLYAEKLRRRPPMERATVARRVARDVCRALAHVHAHGIVHRDVKPGNVIVAQDGRAVLTDFGVALEVDDDGGRQRAPSGGVVGTAAYAAPEQLMGGAVDARADQYGLGCTLYLLLTGKRPFEDDDAAALVHAHVHRAPRPPSELDPTVPADLEAFVLRLLGKDPDERFSDATAAEAAIGSPGDAGIPFAGRQDAIDAVAAAVGRAASGRGVVLRFTGAYGSGRTWMQALAREAAERRGVPCVATEDPHALDVALRHVADGAPLLVVTSLPAPALPMGATGLSGSANQPAAEEIALPPLAVADLRRTVYALAPATLDLARAAERLHRESGGNAGLFLLLAESVRVGERIVLPDGPFAVDVGPWIDGLDLDEETVAGALAALREPVEARALESIAQVPVDAALRALEERGVAAHVGDRWMLAAEALRAPILARQPDADGLCARARAHEADGQEARVPDPVLVEVARLRASGRDADAVGSLEAATRADADPAVRAARLLTLGALHWSMADPARARGAYDAAVPIAGTAALRSRALVGAGACALQCGALEIAIDRLDAAVVEAELARDVPRLVLALVNAAEARALGGALDEALRSARRAVMLAQQTRDRALECLAVRHLGQVLLDVNLADEAGQRLADASALARAADLHDERVAAHVLRARASLAGRPDHRTAAAAALERLLPLLSDSGRDPEGFRVRARALWAEAAAVLGDPRMYARARAAAEEMLVGFAPLASLRARLPLARAALVAGDRARAVREAEVARVEAEACGFRLLAWRADRIVARATGAPLQPPGELALGLDDAQAAALGKV